MKKEKTKERVKCELFGDVHRIVYNEDRKRMEASVLLAPFEIKNLLDCMVSYYANAKTKRRQRICEIARELGKLIYDDSTFSFEGKAFVSKGNVIRLTNDVDFLEAQARKGK